MIKKAAEVLTLQKNANSYSDPDIEAYVKGLEKRESSDLEEELAHLCFDYLFVQTQMEASKFDDPENVVIAQSGERRLSRLQAKIEALKRELFGRMKEPPMRKRNVE